MATKNVVPRADGEGGLGSDSLFFGGAYADKAYLGSVDSLKEPVSLTTADATQTTIWSKTLAEGDAVQVVVRLVAVGSSGVTAANFGKRAVVRRQTGGAAVLVPVGSYTQVSEGVDIKTSSGLDVSFTVSTNDVRVSVTGLPATSVKWFGTVESMRVS